MNTVPLYDALASDYDRFVNWEGRLAHELPFLDRLLAEQGAIRVLDTACGTGHHALALAQRGYQVVGVDLSEAMIEQARINASRAGLPVEFGVAGFGELASLGRTFDALLCLGNSLPHLLTDQDLERALRDFAAVLRPGGLLITQSRNFDLVYAQNERFMPPQSHKDGDREWIFLRFYDMNPDRITFNMIRLRRSGGDWQQDVQFTLLRPLFREGLEASLKGSGFTDLTVYGGCDGSAFDSESSGDLIFVARKA
jgi:SAM-dependent methyltransferase